MNGSPKNPSTWSATRARRFPMITKSERFTRGTKTTKACYIGFEVEVIQKMESYSLIRLGRRKFIVETHDLIPFHIETSNQEVSFAKGAAIGRP
jgi:hypothetical protein